MPPISVGTTLSWIFIQVLTPQVALSRFARFFRPLHNQNDGFLCGVANKADVWEPPLAVVSFLLPDQ
ncbi:unnamed protein product [Peronospora belbahrii]|uniref:Secreted protein n=1 Tax=Peronospora belbahrii TaxID=622444 RepID=A0ABN8CWH4_9STRA|nr:unnamed protein product [Peronospora belbahrii]